MTTQTAPNRKTKADLQREIDRLEGENAYFRIRHEELRQLLIQLRQNKSADGELINQMIWKMPLPDKKKETP